MTAYMYILECSDGSYYTGSTKDIEKRLQEHQDGVGANHTKKRLPVTLVYYEKYDRIDTAFYREKQVQGWSRAKKEALINGEVDVLHILSECQNGTHWLEQYSSAFDSSGFDFAISLVFYIYRKFNLIKFLKNQKEKVNYFGS